MEEVARLALFYAMCIIAGMCLVEGFELLGNRKDRKDALLMMAFGMMLISSALNLPRAKTPEVQLQTATANK